jgi:MscS family membrane protein
MSQINEQLLFSIFESSVLEINPWQFAALIAFGFMAFAVSYALIFAAKCFIVMIFAKHLSAEKKKMLNSTLRPVRAAMTVAIFAAFTQLLKLSPGAAGFLEHIQKLLAFFVAAWFIFAILDDVSAKVTKHFAARHDASLLSIALLSRRAAKGLVLIVVVLMALQNLGIDTTALLAGFGIGGVALALAGQKTAENLFGGIAIVLDQAVRAGDLCRFGDYQGIVEDIGVRSTRIRTSERTVISIPNAEFSQMKVENLTMRDRMRMHHLFRIPRSISLEHMHFVLNQVRDLLKMHSKIDKPTIRVYIVDLSPISAQIEVEAFVLTQDSVEFAAVRENLLLQIKEALDVRKNNPLRKTSSQVDTVIGIS